MSHESAPSSNRAVFFFLVVVLLGYVVALGLRLPQTATAQIIAAETPKKAPAVSPPSASHEHNGDEQAHATPPLWTVLPFAVLLGVIALLPLIPATAHWWESNLHRFYIAAALATVTLLYYLFVHAQPIHGHWPAAHLVTLSTRGPNLSLAANVFANAILSEYIPFMVLLFSLYTISGGIRIEGDLPAHSLTNTAILAVGSLLASFIGTTGAAMLLVRLLLETNRERKHVKHTVIFFIFVVCNCGGCLLPLGDPPLFLGYLMGVPFLWTWVLWKAWLFINVALLIIYFLLDHYWYYPRERAEDIVRDETRRHRVRFGGVWPNALLLLGVVFAIATLGPRKAFPGTDWQPWLYLREAVQLGLVAISLAWGNGHARRANRFNYAAILEVAALFFGIFICMQPALQILEVEGPNLGLIHPWQYFWATGGLSSFLDNAPTYVVFFHTAKAYSLQNNLAPLVAGVEQTLLIAVSLGSVFMGANTYIGNGPNFMVKAIAEEAGVAMPSFFGYMLYSLAILIPLFVVVTWLFL